MLQHRPGKSKIPSAIKADNTPDKSYIFISGLSENGANPCKEPSSDYFEFNLNSSVVVFSLNLYKTGTLNENQGERGRRTDVSRALSSPFIEEDRVNMVCVCVCVTAGV